MQKTTLLCDSVYMKLPIKAIGRDRKSTGSCPGWFWCPASTLPPSVIAHEGRKEVGMGTRVDSDLWRAGGGKWSEVRPSGPELIRERRAQHLLRERGKRAGAWGERSCGNSEGHGRGQVQEGPRSPGRPALVVPKLRRGVMSTPRRSCGERGKPQGGTTSGDIPGLRPLQNKHHQLLKAP